MEQRDEDEDGTPQGFVETGEYVAGKANIVWSRGAPKLELSVKIVATLDKADRMPELIEKALDQLYAKLAEKNLVPGNI